MRLHIMAIIKNNKYRYVGIFFNPKTFYHRVESIRKDKKEKQIELPHITLKYKPEIIDESLFGKEVRVIITGYGSNNNNEGVSVEIEELSADEKIRRMFSEIAVPHITLSISKNGKAVETKYLQFNTLKKKIYLKGTFDGFPIQ